MKTATRKGKAFLKPEGDLTVAKAADFKNALVDSLNKADEVEINLEDVTSMDLACLQLLCSAHLTASKKGKKFTLKDSSLPVFLKAREDACFVYAKSCRLVTTDDCLWVAGGEK